MILLSAFTEGFAANKESLAAASLEGWPNRCPSCNASWAEKIYNTGTCEECACRFEWILAEPAPGQKFNRQEFGRYLEGQYRASKSGSWWLRPIPDFWLSRPLYFVVWVACLFAVAFILGGEFR